MIKNKTRVEKFSKRLIVREKIPYKQAMRIFEALYKEALSLRIIRRDNILDGIEIDLKIAKTLNALL